jgi:ABC-type nitrate/sulfonate/bicarbonate transport system substrate-binding protein
MTPSPLRWGYLPLADSIASLLCCQEMTRAGLPWEPVKFANNHLLLEALQKGEVDGGISSAVFLPPLEKNDKRVKIVGAASREGVTVFAAPEGKFKDLSQLKGATVSIPAKLTVHGALWYKIIQSQGLLWEKDVTVKYLPPAEGFKALAAGEVDLVLALEPLASRIEAEGKFLAVASSRELWPRHLSFIALISAEKVAQNPGVMTKWDENYKKVLSRLALDYQGVAELTAPLLGGDAAPLQRVLQPGGPKILFSEAAINMEEKKEWQKLVTALQALT